MKKKRKKLFGVRFQRIHFLKDKYLWLFVLFCAVFSVNIFAQETTENSQTSDAEKRYQADLDARKVLEKVNPIGNEYQNSIQLLNNRFRIDSDVKKVTLIFFREYGSAPIVLVRPDGSKLYLDNEGVDDSYDWYDTDTYDMISLNDPMPGPWQAVGSVLPQSRVMVIADITLDTDPVPSPVFSGETIKITSELQNAGNKIDFSGFKDVVSLSVEFSSTNNPNYENFGLGTKSVARFEDNGRGYDEQDGDGIFTGQFDLKISPGEWQPIFTVRTPLFSREQLPAPVVLLESPVSVSHTLDETTAGYHLLHVDVNRDYVDIHSLLLDGTIEHPNGDIERFSVTEISEDARIVDIINAGYGEYKINMTVFSNSVSGRDLVLNVPEYTFDHKMPILEEPIVNEEALEAQELTVVETPVEESTGSTLALVLGINIGILFIGCGVIFIILDKRKNPENPFFKRLSLKVKRKPKKDEEAENKA
ncbi:TIGR03503 family protein [Agaribacter marinus]|uniref:TIGR03503 family protein n=1 Tax=Agaribacter marinus TaxID=1431249 RepID=A0AA37WHT1_9ALTE|nr:TIGR03503 family protein [Agaribacter marinus]GLR70157.1 TIGR03503 family protein [Agaribacter marinus]